MSRASCSPASDPTCGCKTSSKTQNSTFDEILAAVTFSQLLPFATNTFSILGNDVDALFNQPNIKNAGGAGCTFYQSLPDQIALPESAGIAISPAPVSVLAVSTSNPSEKMKLVISYLSVSEADLGVAFHATAQLVARTPAVQISGASSVSIDYRASETSARYAVLFRPLQARDFVGTLTFEWSGDSQYVQIADPTQQSTRISFSGGDNMRPGASITRTINVRVTDSEGSTATASFSVLVSKSRKGPANPE